MIQVMWRLLINPLFQHSIAMLIYDIGSWPAGFEHSDWVETFEQPIIILQTSLT